jgi:hypothetical protein
MRLGGGRTWYNPTHPTTALGISSHDAAVGLAVVLKSQVDDLDRLGRRVRAEHAVAPIARSHTLVDFLIGYTAAPSLTRMPTMRRM